jgi:hypothetical protein
MCYCIIKLLFCNMSGTKAKFKKNHKPQIDVSKLKLIISRKDNMGPVLQVKK